MNILSTHRDIAASPADVFAAMSIPERLARWWGPAGFSNRVAECDLRPGGVWRFDMVGPDGTVYPNTCRFEAIEPEARLVIRHTNAPHFTLTLRLSPIDGGTRVDWAQAFDDDAVAEALRTLCEPANEQNLDRLTAEVMSGD